MAAVLLRSEDELRPDPNRTKVLVFVSENGRWLVDEEIELVQVPECELPVEVATVVGPPPGATFDAWPSACAERDELEARDKKKSRDKTRSTPD